MSRYGWQVRVDVDGGSDGDAGFLFTDRHVLTCKHVIDGAESIDITFVHEPGMPAVGATVTVSGPWTAADRTGAGDYALLTLDRPVSVEPARFGPLGALELGEAGGLSAWGFPADFRDGLSVSLLAKPGSVAGEASEIDPAGSAAVHFGPGFSGAAVCSQVGEVVGMIVSSASSGTTEVGRMLPVAVLVQHLPDLLDHTRRGPMSPAAYRQLRELLPPRATVPVWLVNEVVGAHAAAAAAWPRAVPLLAMAERIADLAIRPEAVWAMIGQLFQRFALEVDPTLGAPLRDWVTKHWWDLPSASEPHDVVAVRPRSVAFLVVVEPTAHGRDSYRLTMWMVTDLQDRPDERLHEEVLSWRGVKRVVQDKLHELINKFVPPNVKLVIEFVLPQRRLPEPVDSWRYTPDIDIGRARPVVVRDLDRFRNEESRDLAESWQLLRARAKAGTGYLFWLRCRTPVDPQTFATQIWGDERELAIAAASAPRNGELVSVVARSSVPVMLWRRGECDHADPAEADCAGGRFEAELTRSLAGTGPDDLPQAVHRLRRDAGTAGAREHCGREISLLWDDPRRRPHKFKLQLS